LLLKVGVTDKKYCDTQPVGREGNISTAGCKSGMSFPTPRPWVWTI